MPNAMNCGVSPVLALELDRNGKISKKTMKLDRKRDLPTASCMGFIRESMLPRLTCRRNPSIHVSRP